MNRDTTNEWRVVQVDRAGKIADQIICISIDGEWTKEITNRLNDRYADSTRRFEAYPPSKALWEPKSDRITEDFNRAMKIVAGESWVDKNPFNS